MTLFPKPNTAQDSADASLTQVLYRSRAILRVESGMQMSDILDEARAGNARDRITGALTSVDGSFVQIIEGPGPMIDGLLRRLATDTRHADLQVLERRVVNERLFGDWDMVSPRLASVEVAALQRLFRVPEAGIDAYAAILLAGVAQQDAVLEGRRTPDRADHAPHQPGGVTSTPEDRPPTR